MDNIKDIALTSPAKWGTIAGKIDENLREAAGARTVTYSTDVATTRKQIKSQERKYGLILSYVHPELGDIQERYIGKTTDDSSWQNNANWEAFVKQKQIGTLSNQLLTEVDKIKNEYIQEFEEINIGNITDGQMLKKGVVTSFSGRAVSDMFNVEKYRGLTLTCLYIGI